MMQAVKIFLKDAACGASIAAACRALDIAVDDAAPLLITDDENAVGAHNRVVWLGQGAPKSAIKTFELPLSLSVLMATIAPLIAQSEPATQCGDLTIETGKRIITKGDKQASLTDKESQLLLLLLAHQGEVVVKDVLLHKIWGYQPDLDTHTLETHIYRLRNKCASLGSKVAIDAKDGGYVIILS
jgi:DNA-binding response OmpR family regulator